MPQRRVVDANAWGIAISVSSLDSNHTWSIIDLMGFVSCDQLMTYAQSPPKLSVPFVFGFFFFFLNIQIIIPFNFVGSGYTAYRVLRKCVEVYVDSRPLMDPNGIFKVCLCLTKLVSRQLF